MQSGVTKSYLADFVQACQETLDYFIDTESLLGKGVHSLMDINEVLDLNDVTFKTIYININPYKRVVLFYHAIMAEENRDIPFAEFVKEYLDPANKYASWGALANAIDYLKPAMDLGINPGYIIEFDNFEADIRKIPEFETVENVNYLQKAQDDAADYKTFYDDESKQLVADAFQRDIEYWGFTFD